MEIIVKVDKQSQVILLKDFRKALEIEDETEMVCRVVGNRIVLEKLSVEAIHKVFVELEDIVPSLEFDTVKMEGINMLTGNMHSAKLGFKALVEVGIIVPAHFKIPSKYHQLFRKEKKV